MTHREFQSLSVAEQIKFIRSKTTPPKAERRIVCRLCGLTIKVSDHCELCLRKEETNG